MKNDIEQYSKMIKPNTDYNPLDWWKIHESAYSILAKLVFNTCASEWLTMYSHYDYAFILLSGLPLTVTLLKSLSTYLIKYRGIPNTVLSL